MIVGEKRPGTTALGSLLRKKAKATKSTYQVVLHDDDFNTITDRVYDSMTEPITTFKTEQEVMEKAFEGQLTELKCLVSHTSNVAIQTPV